jgi:hypothetical protein
MLRSIAAESVTVGCAATDLDTRTGLRTQG